MPPHDPQYLQALPALEDGRKVAVKDVGNVLPDDACLIVTVSEVDVQIALFRG